MRAADRLLPNGMGLMLVGTVLRIALLVVPPLVGVIADASSLRAALLVMPAGALLVMRAVAGAQRWRTVSFGQPPKCLTAMAAASSGSNALHENTST